jgi:hypothetical protein|tara:strand:- start:423 stop:587 length:165 start_codon:yes stop_codon:yes gene_type:complete
MNVKLYHPVHGTKIAIAEAEVEADLRNGWVRGPEDVPAANQLKRQRRQGAEARC